MAVFDKLNLKEQNPIVVINAPLSFEPEIASLQDRQIVRDLKQKQAVSFLLAFATQQTVVDRLAKQLAKKVSDDAVVWFAYPKGTSKNYSCDFNRDTGWTVLRELGFDTVRQIAIDDDWSALRFRRTEFIKRAGEK